MTERMEYKYDKNGVLTKTTRFAGWTGFKIGDVVNEESVIVGGKYYAGPDNPLTPDEVVNLTLKALRTFFKRPDLNFNSPDVRPLVHDAMITGQMGFGYLDEPTDEGAPRDKTMGLVNSMTNFPKASDERGRIVHITDIVGMEDLLYHDDGNKAPDLELVKRKGIIGKLEKIVRSVASKNQ